MVDEDLTHSTKSSEASESADESNFLKNNTHFLSDFNRGFLHYRRR